MASKRRKNILFIFTDQQHRYALGCMGTRGVFTPNLDRLAREGVLFRNAYSNCPLCTPFRINLFTGKYASQTGCFDNNAAIPDGCPTLADALNDLGYETSYVGKWHVGGAGNKPIPEEHRGGFKHFIGYYCYNGFYNDVCFYDEDGVEHCFDRHRTDVTTDLAIERLKAVAEKPFAMFVSYQAPHYPVQPSPEFEAMYEGVAIPRRPNRQDIDPYTPTFSPPSPRPFEKCPDYRKYGGDLDAYIRLYNAMVTQIDAGVGRILRALEKLGRADDTVVIFTSDHGDMQGAHGLKNKSLPHEESSGIPLIVRDPSGARGLVSDALTSGVDFFPTCLDFAGADADPDLPGRNFAPLLRGETLDLTGPVFAEMRTWKMVRKGELKLVVEGDELSPTMLFDLKNDPYEMNNLVEDSAFAEERENLRAEILSWLERCAKSRCGDGVG